MSRLRRSLAGFIAIISVIGITACGPSDPNIRPTDEQLKDAISLLIKNFTARHPDEVTWKADAVNKQLSSPLPHGYSTEAGWYLKWNDYAPDSLPEVYVPWDLIGQYPTGFSKSITSYSERDGRPVPSSVLQKIRVEQLKNVGDDPYFAAIVGVKYSKIDPSWIIFTSTPFLPVTDPAYGWATVTNGKWRVTDFGTALVGCGKVPTSVQKEFGHACP